MRVRPAPTAAVVLLAVASLAAIALEVLAPRQRPALDSTAALEAAIEQELVTERALRQLDLEREAHAQAAPVAQRSSGPASPPVATGLADGSRPPVPPAQASLPPTPPAAETPASPSAGSAPSPPIWTAAAGAAEEPMLPPPDVRRGELFYFFSPDWRPADFGKLAVAVEAAFGSGGLEVSFQAFTKYDDFVRQVLNYPPKFLMAPAWIGDAGTDWPGARYMVVARPVRNEKTTYRKALMTRPGIDSIDDLTRGSIAATVHSIGPGDPGAVLSAFRLAGDSARIVPVPKDVDALLALSFGQVDAALVTSEQYEQLSRTNPADTARMRVLAFTPEIGLPPVYAAASCDPGLRRRLDALLQRLPEVSEGPTVLALLGIDRFASEPGEPAETPHAPSDGSNGDAGSAGDGARKAVAKSPPPDKKKPVGAAAR